MIILPVTMPILYHCRESKLTTVQSGILISAVVTIELKDKNAGHAMNEFSGDLCSSVAKWKTINRGNRELLQRFAALSSHWPLDIGSLSGQSFISYLLSGSKDMSLDPSSVFAILIGLMVLDN